MQNKEWNKEKYEAFTKAWAKIIAKAWSDPAFKQRLLKDPLTVFKENGIELPPGVQCKVNESTDKIVYLSLPKKPSGEVSEESLKKIAGGYCYGSVRASGGLCEAS
ncbi:MAG: NHLP leader peptide family RiPP precursor [Rhabdochlamydiaceae bacterium]|jgi:hypothetical protein